MKRISERGQAMPETALFAILAILMAFGLLSWIPLHRARTAAAAAHRRRTPAVSRIGFPP